MVKYVSEKYVLLVVCMLLFLLSPTSPLKIASHNGFFFSSVLEMLHVTLFFSYKYAIN